MFYQTFCVSRIRKYIDFFNLPKFKKAMIVFQTLKLEQANLFVKRQPETLRALAATLIILLKAQSLTVQVFRLQVGGRGESSNFNVLVIVNVKHNLLNYFITLIQNGPFQDWSWIGTGRGLIRGKNVSLLKSLTHILQ